MDSNTFSENGTWATGRKAKLGIGWHVVAYDGDLGGGTLQVFGKMDDDTEIAVPDSKISAATVDENEDAVQQIEFRTLGEIVVKLTGATSPDVTVYCE